MGGFPSGQREQTVNLPSQTSMVRIHPRPPFSFFAGMAELADALDSGSSESNFMQVQVLFPAPKKKARQKRWASFFVNSGNGLEEAAMNQAPVGLENGADRAASSRENPVLFPAPKKKARQKRRASFFVNSGNGLEEAAMNQAPVGLENRIGDMVYWAQ